MALVVSFSMIGCAAQTEPEPTASDGEATIPSWGRTLDYSRCYAVLQELGTRPEFQAEVAALQSEVGDDGLSTAQTICTRISEVTLGLSGTLATTMGPPGVSGARAVAAVLSAIVGIASIAVLSSGLLRHLVGGMLLDSNVQSPGEIARADINASYDAAWAALPFESQQSLESHKEWLKDMLTAWVVTFSNSIEAKREKPGTRHCYAVVFGDSKVARDTWDYAVSDCTQDTRTCISAQNKAAHNMRLLQSATPSIGIYYNACFHDTRFFIPPQ